MQNNKTFGFIGTGNLATAIVLGILSQGDIKPENIYIYDISPEKTQILSKCRVSVANSPVEIATLCDYIFLTVKPAQYKEVLEQIAPHAFGKCLVCVAAGVKTDYVKSILGFDAKVIRVMPNTPILVGKGASALVHKAPVSDEEFKTVFDIFDTSGFAAKVDEEYINAVTAISGSAPAYLFRFASVIMDFAIEQGLDPLIALSLFAQTLEGSAKMLKNSGNTPEQLIRNVSSPGGTTIAALTKFDEMGFDDTIMQALNACTRRAEELGDN